MTEPGERTAATSPPPERPRLVLVEDIAALRTALPALLPAYDLVEVYSDTTPLLVERPAAELVLLDLGLRNESQPQVAQGLAAVRSIVDAGYRVCLYTQEERPLVLAACIGAGAVGLVAKSDPITVLSDTIARVLAGEVVLPSALIGLAEVLMRRGNLGLLSPRQRQLLAGRARGRTYAEIGAELHLSDSTLRGYWADLCAVIAGHLRETSPADIERALGVAPGDLLDP